MCLLTLLAMMGALYPQETRAGMEALGIWQAEHRVATRVGEWLGLFHIFHSPLFLSVVGLLLLNTLICTVRTVFAWSEPFSQKRWIRNAGFLVLHTGLLILGSGGLISAGFRLDGFIVLIEGQTFQESHDGYQWLFESPFRKEVHQGYQLTLHHVAIDAERDRELMVTSRLDLVETGNSFPVSITSSVNRPARFSGVYLTQDRTGYAPFLRVMNRMTGQPLAAGFVGLQRFDTPEGRVHKDQLELPMGNVFTITFHPASEGEGEPNRLTLDLDRKDKPVGTVEIHQGQSERFDQFIVSFDDTRRWSSFRIMEDPGYRVVLWGLWISLAGFVLRYLQDIVDWLTTAEPDRNGGCNGND